MAFQAAIALGAPWGVYTQGGGTSGQLPAGGRVIAVVSIAILALLAAGLLNMATPSEDERMLWAPVSVALAAGSLVTVIGTRRRPNAK